MPSVVSRSRSPLTSTLSTTHCIRKGLKRTKASSAKASSRIWPMDRFRPVTGPRSCRTVTCRFSSAGAKPPAGVSSSTTPVKWRDASSSLMRRAPRAGSWISSSSPFNATSTTKWFMSQCSTQGSCSWRISSISARRARECSCRLSAMRTRSASVAPLSDNEKRCRSVARSVCRPCAPATMARQARPHSAASVCRISGT
jgi:hypothetical protein